MQKCKHHETKFEEMTVNHRFAEFRKANFSLINNWVFQDGKEILDTEPNTERAVRVARDLDRLNQWFLYPLLTLKLIQRLSLLFERERRPLTFIDICTGYGGFCRYLAAAAVKKGIPLQIFGIDSSHIIIQAASHLPNPQNITFGVADACKLPFKDKKFDFASNVYSLHHFDAETAVHVLREGARVARTFLFYDLRRTLHGFITARFHCLFSQDFVRDAVISNRKAYSVKEMCYLVREAGIEAVARRFGNGMIIESEI